MDRNKEITKESYNKNGEVFDEKFKGLFDLDKRDEFRIFMDLVPGKRILDLGCGGGDHALYFQQQGYQVTAIDLSEKMVEIAQRKGLAARVMDMEHLDFPRNSFDGTWSVTSILHIPKKMVPQLIKNVYELLTERGIWFVCLKEGDGEGLVRDSNSPATQRFFAYWRQDELIRTFSPYFQLVDFSKKKPHNTTYLRAFFERKD